MSVTKYCPIRTGVSGAVLLCTLLMLAACRSAIGWVDRSPHISGFVRVNGIRLQYLDWGGSGPALIFVPGLGDNPHVFDDLAPAFIDHFHVISYARRGSGESDAKGPYDTATLAADLIGLMDARGISRADLVGWSMGGTEITAVAAQHPERVRRLVYFDSFDLTDPAYMTAIKALPANVQSPPSNAESSLDAYRAYEQDVDYATLDDMGRIEASLRNSVVVQPDGTVKKKAPQSAFDALFTTIISDHRDYRRVHEPVLAIFADSVFNLGTPDLARRAIIHSWQETDWVPFRERAIDRLKHDMPQAEIVRLPGAHRDFFLVSRKQVVKAMRRFLDAQTSG